MSASPEVQAEKPKKSARSRYYWPLRVVLVLGFLELFARQFVARPNRILRHSPDAEMVYENTPGNWLGHAKYDIWTAPIYMVLDLVNLGSAQHEGPPPVGYTLYRIDDDGCRVPSEGPSPKSFDVVVLGSSQAFGLFVPEEDTVSAMLERELRARSFKGAQVGNCGVIGHHFPQTLRTGERIRPNKAPKVIAVLVRPWHMRVQFDYTKVLDPDNAAMKWITRGSSLARVMYYYYRREPDQFEAGLVPDAVLEERLDHYVHEMSQSGVRTVFYLLDDQAPDCAVFDTLGPMLQRKGFPVERVITPNGPNEYFVDHDHHWSAKGAAVMTSQMIDSVTRELEAASSRTGGGAEAPR